ncbi:MAG: translation initiation factor IF-6 [Methanobacteriota archaeon]|nr:MAG: translation initiation factor IF-6 [Euryarchaeota archaeon]TLZ90463.1 MAG: translation initiation factor IF-6 [Euryarchaeota archaeon]
MSSMSTCGSVAASIRPAGSASRRSSSRTAPPSSPSRRTEGPQLLRRLEIAGNPYIGVFCAANDELLIVARDVPKSAIRHIGGALETSPIVTSVGHSTVVGSLLALNSKGILASPFIEEAEIEAIGDAVYPLPHRLNAVGNNVLCNDYGAVVHPGYDDEAVAFIGEVLGVSVVRGTIAGIKTVGSVAVATNKGVLCHPHARPGEMEVLKSTLQVPVVITTANYGAAQVGACMVANSHGAVVGSRTTPIELGRIEEGLSLF